MNLDKIPHPLHLILRISAKLQLVTKQQYKFKHKQLSYVTVVDCHEHKTCRGLLFYKSEVHLIAQKATSAERV